jgi:23S rRNA pseudouridine2457 synthase
LNKPYGVLSQFTSDSDTKTLKNFIEEPGFYPAGRLDKDSEGLLVLTKDGKLQSEISDPKYKKNKKQQVELLKKGVALKDGLARAISCRIIPSPNLWDRNPPVRKRKQIPTSWIEITLNEGKNRQVRRMTAKIGFPTLRLVRTSIAHWSLGDLKPGESVILNI